MTQQQMEYFIESAMRWNCSLQFSFMFNPFNWQIFFRKYFSWKRYKQVEVNFCFLFFQVFFYIIHDMPVEDMPFGEAIEQSLNEDIL